jgi:PAS domain S-box-containing protein
VLNARGVILTVNRAWRQFAEANPPLAGNVNEGANYLAVCDAAAGSDREIARAFAAGIRAVMAGTIPFFELEYPCHSPEIHRWFVGRVTPFGSGPLGHVAIAHESITQRRRAEERFRALFESSQDAIMTLEPPLWRFTSGNPATVRLFRAKDEAEFTAKEPWTLSPECQPDGRPSSDKAREMIETAMRAGSHSFEWMHRRIDGEDFLATVLLTRMEENGKGFLQATIRDITRQKRDEEQLRRMLKESDESRQALLGMAEDQQKAAEELRRKMEEMDRFNRLTVDRELRMIELKREVNDALRQACKEAKYRIVKED